MGGCVGFRTDLVALEKIKNSCSCWKSNLSCPAGNLSLYRLSYHNYVKFPDPSKKKLTLILGYLHTVFKIILFKQKPIGCGIVTIIKINGPATGIAWFSKVLYSEMEFSKRQGACSLPRISSKITASM
jgi:hypothetical protein